MGFSTEPRRNGGRGTLRELFLAVLLLVPALSDATQRPTELSSPERYGLEPGDYAVGFRLLRSVDASRTVTGGVSPSARPRPMRVYLWYPAQPSDGAEPMRFGRYAALADEDLWPTQTTNKLRYANWALARRLGSEAFERLLQQPVHARENADALEGAFPLIVIGQGLYFEFPASFAALAEYLAGRGFVVASTPLAGTNSPFVRIDGLDLETQVRDLEYAMARARELPFVSPEKLGVFGFDMGGMAGVILTMRNPDVDAFVSVSSGILFEHPSGLPRASSSYDPSALRVPWLHSMAASWMEDRSEQPSPSLFDVAVHSERFLLLTEGMDHFDYSSYALIDGPWTTAEPEGVEGHKIVSRYVANFYTAFLKGDSEARAFLDEDLEKFAPGTNMTLRYRPAEPAAMTYEAFVHEVISGRGESAVEAIRDLRGRDHDPDHVLLKETYLQRLVASLQGAWGLTDEALPVVRFWVELYPSSLLAQRTLAESYVELQELPAAIAVYESLAEQHPDDERIRSRLEALRQRER